MPSPWVKTLKTKNEDGEPEVWEFGFKRVPLRMVLEFQEFADIDDDDLDLGKIKQIVELLDKVTRWIKWDGEPVGGMLDVPTEILDKVMALHPSFRPSAKGKSPKTRGVHSGSSAR